MKQIRYIVTAVWMLSFSFIIYPQEFQRNNYEVYYPFNDSPKAVCMVIHGLNNNHHSMQWIRSQLLEQGAIVVNVTLWGHGNNPILVRDSTQLEERLDKFKEVSWSQWMSDMGPAIEYIDSVSRETSLPKYFFGFSLGGLIGSSISINYNFEFDKYFLLAPAIKIKALPKIAVGFMSPYPNKIIKSKTPLPYRENRGVPVAAYKALLKGAKEFKKAQPYLNNCLIIVDKKDQVVSARKLSRYAKENKYTIEVIRKNKKECTYCDNPHLIVDEASLGPSSELVSNKIALFFNSQF